MEVTTKHTADCAEWNGVDLGREEGCLAFATYELDASTQARVGQVMIAGMNEEQLTIWTTSELPGVFDIKFDRTGTRIAAATADGRCYVCDDVAGTTELTWNAIDLGVENGFALSLDWNDRVHQQQETAIVVSRSDGFVSKVVQNESEWDTMDWLAHTYPGDVPAEVWIAGFDCFEPDTIVTGADDGLMKLWDLRVGTDRPLAQSRHHEAGVCSLQFHPRRQSVFATGSYDSKLRIWDRRNLKQPVSEPFDFQGGIWRVKWHPHSDSLLALACMRSGFNIYDHEKREILWTFNNDLESGSWEALGYGIDWAPFFEPKNKLFMATTSFYDRTIRVLPVDLKTID